MVPSLHAHTGEGYDDVEGGGAGGGVAAGVRAAATSMLAPGSLSMHDSLDAGAGGGADESGDLDEREQKVPGFVLAVELSASPELLC